ncbi:MAG: hypothetical protein M0003_19260 [Acidithiobacillus sp.]|nr:hypothetical protein [Acidithiobacillus sp.]
MADASKQIWRFREGDELTIEVLPDGQVLVNGAPVQSIAETYRKREQSSTGTGTENNGKR